MKLRPEVEAAIRDALATWDGPDLPNALLEHAASDSGFNLSWTHPEEARRVLLALVELGVRLALEELRGPAFSEQIRQAAVNDILQAQPGAEE